MFGFTEGSTIIFEIKDDIIQIRKETTPEEFLTEFIKTPKKLAKKIDIKKIIDEQIEERI